MDIPYAVEHSLHGQTVNPDETYVRERDGKWFAFIRVRELVFKNPQPFDTELDAKRFNQVTRREGAQIS